MIVDSSAILAILLREPGSELLLDKLATVDQAGIGAPSLVETGIVLTNRIGKDARGTLSVFLTEAQIQVIPFGQAHWRTAIEAYQRFGKGRHRAALNFGDCMAYATARLADQPILCMGTEFARTDLTIA